MKTKEQKKTCKRNKPETALTKTKKKRNQL